MKKLRYVTFTILIMLIISRFLIRIADATMQLDNFFWLPVIVLILTNASIGYISYRIYRKKKEKI